MITTELLFRNMRALDRPDRRTALFRHDVDRNCAYIKLMSGATRKKDFNASFRVPLARKKVVRDGLNLFALYEGEYKGDLYHVIRIQTRINPTAAITESFGNIYTKDDLLKDCAGCFHRMIDKLNFIAMKSDILSECHI